MCVYIYIFRCVCVSVLESHYIQLQLRLQRRVTSDDLSEKGNTLYSVSSRNVPVSAGEYHLDTSKLRSNISRDVKSYI